MRIKDSTIEEVKNLVQIEEVVGDFVSLKKKGQNMWACCPFHNEKTPSFSVAPNKGIYKCFGCGESGDAIKFVMSLEGFDYMDAIKYLANKYGVEVEEEQQSEEAMQAQGERDSLFIIQNFANTFFMKNLVESEEGRSIGLSYFKERGFPDEIIKQFELGYSLDSWDGLIKEAKEGGYNEDLLVKSGLVVKKEEDNKMYDRFRGRVIFPIHNVAGKVIAFGARTLKSTEKSPKYLNSPETDIYHKSKILYGIFQAKQAIRQEDSCFLVEGYTDVISLHMAGVPNVVASSGTSLTTDQIRLISRYTKNITVLFDGDPAGLKASLRGIDLILEGDMNVKVVVFPEGEDPDSYSQKTGTEKFKTFLKEEAKDFITFKAELYADETKNDPIKKTEVIKGIVESIAKIPDTVKREVYIKQCSTVLDISESALVTELNRVVLKGHQEQRRTEERNVDIIPQPKPEERDARMDLGTLVAIQERESIRLLISHGYVSVDDEGASLYDFLLTELADVEFQVPIHAEIMSFYKEQLKTGKRIDEKYVINHAPEHIKDFIIKLIANEYTISENWKKQHNISVPEEKEIVKRLAQSNIYRLNMRIIERLIETNMKGFSVPDLSIERQEELQKMHMKLIELKRENSEPLGIVVSR